MSCLSKVSRATLFFAVYVLARGAFCLSWGAYLLGSQLSGGHVDDSLEDVYDDLCLCWVSSECSKYCIAPVASIIFLIRDSLKSWPAVLVVLPPGRYHIREGHRSSLTHVASIDFLSHVPVYLPTVDGAPLQRVGVDTGIRSLYGDDDKTTKREVGEIQRASLRWP